MKKNKPKNLNRAGGWSQYYGFYFPMAIDFLHQVTELKRGLDKEVEKIKKETRLSNPKLDNKTIDGFANHLTSMQQDRFSALCISVQLFACMAVESFLNFYGVKRLGDDFYKQNIERLGITQKLGILIAISIQHMEETDGDLSKLAKKMFDRRNKLVHPKSKEFGIIKGKLVLPEMIDLYSDAQQSVKDMKRFFELFLEIEPEIGPSIQYLLKEDEINTI